MAHHGRVGRDGDTDGALEAAIRDLLATRAAAATICPSEAARKVALQRGSAEEDAWRPLMESARQAARRLVDRGEVEVLQRGRVVDPATAKGPVRIRRVRVSYAQRQGFPPSSRLDLVRDPHVRLEVLDIRTRAPAHPAPPT